MLATFITEFSLAMYVLWRHRASSVARVIVGLLTCLGVFQLAEWMVCQGALGLSSSDWARIGFVAISFLPPMGIHLATLVSGRSASNWTYAGYAGAVSFSTYFLLATQGITGSVCGGNYVIFQVAPRAINFFTMYYYLLLLIGVGIALYWGKRSRDSHARQALYGLAAGYSAFIVPTIAVYRLNPATAAGIPSIMCGFAVMLAIILVFWVLPKHLESRYAETGSGSSKPLRATH